MDKAVVKSGILCLTAALSALSEQEHRAMKILLISFSSPGTDGRLAELINVCKTVSETRVIFRACDEKSKSGDRNFVFRSNGRFSYLKFILFCTKCTKRIKQADMVFADNRAAVIPALICAKLLNSQYKVYDARELYLLSEVRHFRGKVGCVVEKIFVRKFNLVMCANKFRAEFMKKLFGLGEMPLVFENIRRLEKGEYIAFEETYLKTENLIDTNKINIVSSSGCIEERKCGELARAVCELGDRYKLFFVGDSDKNTLKEVEKIKQEYGCENVICVGRLEKSVLKHFVGLCDIGVVNYSDKGINNRYCASGKIYEYLFEGLPVVTTENPPLMEMCKKYEIGVSDNGFKDGIRTLSENIEYYRENVRKYIDRISPEENNERTAREIMRRLKIYTNDDSRKSKEEQGNGAERQSCGKEEYSKILFVTSGYPTEGKQLYAFLDALVCAMADLGRECTVVYPVSRTHFMLNREKLPPTEWEKTTKNGNIVRILCPRIITFSNGKILHKMRGILNYYFFSRAVKRTIRKYRLSFDLVYGHFLCPAGFSAAEIGKIYKVPSCMAYGENTAYNVEVFGAKKSRKMIENITACISVSSENTRFLEQSGIIPKEKTATIPNAVDRRVFYPKDKMLMRKKYGISPDSFVVAFTGYFTDIKGSLRLSDALGKIEDVHSIFIGSGEMKPNCKNIDFIGSIPHDEVADLLSAADIFVLPTTAEGCCNAIIEALACGLPVVSSYLPFNDDILNERCSIRIDTRDTDAIAEAILFLRDNEDARTEMSREALKHSELFDINVRAEKIIEWIRQCDKNSVNEANFIYSQADAGG